MSKKILFVVEGEVAEVVLLRKLNKIMFPENEYSIISYGSAIYELYDEMRRDNSIELLGLLREKKVIKKNKNDSSNRYSSIFLIFDFDPHYHKYSPEVLKEMIKFFNDDRENGKLYINYPMVESTRHLTTMPDGDFKKRIIHCDDICRYKEQVHHESSYTEINKYNYDIVFHMICHHLAKVEYMITKKWVLPTQEDYTDLYTKRLEMILEIQINHVTNNQISVLSTALFFLIDLKPISFFSRVPHHAVI